MAEHPSRHPSSNGFSNFEYKPLDLSSIKSSIRLAVLFPGIQSSTVRITLLNTAFAERPRYEALSYTWGRLDVLKGIEVNGRRVDVRENLWEALVHLRDTNQGCVLWIDAICINQADLEERNNQVKLMAYIYTRAQKVLVWLGDTGINDAAKGKRFTELDSEEIIAICNRPYWKRVWIVQEIGAATELQVHWGKNSESWDKFFDTVGTLSRREVELAVRLWEQREGRGGSRSMQVDFARTRPGEEVPFPPPLLDDQGESSSFNPFRVRGLPSERITFIGPTYDDIIGIPEAMRFWKATLSSNCYMDVQHLRRKNEEFLRILLDLDKTDLAKVHPIEPYFSWKYRENTKRIQPIDIPEAEGFVANDVIEGLEVWPRFIFDRGTFGMDMFMDMRTLQLMTA